MRGQAERLTLAIQKRGYESAADFARSIDVAEGTVRAQINRDSIPKRAAEAYAKKLKLPVSWLLFGQGNDPFRADGHIESGDVAAGSTRGTAPEQLPAYSGALTPSVIEIGKTAFTAVGRYDAKLSAGPGCILDPHAEPLGYHLVESTWLQTITRAKPEFLALLRVDGDSMVPTLENDDWVLIDRTQTRVTRQGIYALAVGDDAWIKRLTIDLAARKVMIISDNPRWPTQLLPEDELRLIGRYLALIWRKSAA